MTNRLLRQLQWLPISLAAPAYWLGIKAFSTPCIYQSYKCGFTLMSVYCMTCPALSGASDLSGLPVKNLRNQNSQAPGYTVSKLTAAVNDAPSIPPLSVAQLTQVIYHCEDILGNTTGNAYCVNGCLPTPTRTEDDQCQIAGNRTCPPPITVTVSGCGPIFVTICVGGNCTGQPAIIPMTAAPLVTVF